MSRVEYNREAIALIRKGASAADLGWDEEFYTRVRRQHGLPPGQGLPLPAIPVPPSAPQQKRRRRRRLFDYRHQCTVSCPPWMHEGVKREATAADVPMSDLIRTALLKPLDPLPPWRRDTDGAYTTFTAMMTADEEQRAKSAASLRGLPFNEYARRAVAAWLDHRRSNLAKTPMLKPDNKVGLSR